MEQQTKQKRRYTKSPNFSCRSPIELKIEDLLQDRGKLKNYEIAKKYGVSLSWLVKEFKKKRIQPLQAGRPEIKFEDQKVNVGGMVKRKHFLEVQSLITELIQPYR